MFLTKPLFAVGTAVWLSSTAAHALTADQVWKDWQANAKAVGLLLTADPATTVGGEMTLRNIQIMAEAEVVFRVPEMTLVENADSTVNVTVPGTMDLAPPPTENMTAAVTVKQTGLTITIAEPAPDARTYDFAAESVEVIGSVQSMVDMYDGGALQPGTSEYTVTLGGMSGTYSDTPGTNRSFGAGLNFSSINVIANQTDPFTGTSTQNSTAKDLVMNAGFVMPAAFDLAAMENPSQMADALRAGLAVKMDFSQASGSSDQSLTSDFLTFAVTSVSGGSDMALSFDKTGFVAEGESQPISLTVTSPDMPFPQLDVALGTTALAFKLPVIGPEVQDFRYMFKIASLTVNDEAWAAFDPTAVLARTPIVLDVDVTGRTSLDLFGLIQANDDGTVPPVPQVERADIVRLFLSGAGAELSGTGAFTFDNSAGYPLPRGNADLIVKGANKMIDALITLGVVTSDEAMGARMAMALILEPTAEPDVMTSKIEAREDGGLYVNGQRMQ